MTMWILPIKSTFIGAQITVGRKTKIWIWIWWVICRSSVEATCRWGWGVYGHCNTSSLDLNASKLLDCSISTGNLFHSGIVLIANDLRKFVDFALGRKSFWLKFVPSLAPRLVVLSTICVLISQSSISTLLFTILYSNDSLMFFRRCSSSAHLRSLSRVVTLVVQL